MHVKASKRPACAACAATWRGARRGGGFYDPCTKHQPKAPKPRSACADGREDE